MVTFPKDLYSVPTAIYIYGRQREPVNLLGFSLARVADARFLCLSVRDPSNPPAPEELRAAKTLAPNQLFVTYRPQDLAPEPDTASRGVWTVIREDESKDVVGELNEFMRMPTMVQSFWDLLVPAGTPRVFALFNGDRIAHLYPDDSPRTPGFIDLFRREKITFLVAACREEGRAPRFHFPYVLRVDPPDHGHWSEGSLVVEKGTAGGPFAAGQRIRLREIVEFARTLAEVGIP